MLGFHESVTLCSVDGVPAPVNGCVREESEALLTKEMVPEEVPAVSGVKVTV